MPVRRLRPAPPRLGSVGNLPAAGASAELVYALCVSADTQNLSLADLIQLAGAYAVKMTGGPSIPVPVGRKDASVADPPGRIPGEGFDGAGKVGSRKGRPLVVASEHWPCLCHGGVWSGRERPAASRASASDKPTHARLCRRPPIIRPPAAEQLRARFTSAGLSVREMVALSGAHTIGGKGFGDPVTFDNTYFKTLMEKCAPACCCGVWKRCCGGGCGASRVRGLLGSAQCAVSRADSGPSAPTLL